MTKFFTFPERRPAATLLIASAVVVMAIAAVSRLEPSGSLTAMFPQRHANSRALASIADRFAGTDSLLIVVTAADEGQGRRLLEFAGRLESELRADSRAAPMIASVQYRASPQFHRFVEEVVAPSLIYYLADAGMEELRQRLTPQGMADRLAHAEAAFAAAGPAAPLVKLLVRDPLGLHELVIDRVAPAGVSLDETHLSTDGRSLLIQIAATRPVSDMDFVTALMTSVRSAADRARPGDLRIEYCGAYAIAEVAQREIRADMIGAVIGSVVMMQALFLLTYRRLLAFPLAFAPVGIGILIGFAAAGLVSPSLSPPTAVAGAVLAGLGIDYCVHYLSHYYTQRSAAAIVTRQIAPALLAGCTTSVIAFAAIGLSDIPALRQFALIGVVGLIGSLLAALTVLPAALTLIGRRGAGGGGGAWLRWTGEPIVRLVARRRAACMGLVVALFIGAATVAVMGWDSGDVLERDLNAMHPRPNSPLALQSQIAERFFAAPDPLLVLITGASDAELLRRAHDLRRALEHPSLAGHIAGTFGPAHLLPDPAALEPRRAQAAALDAERVVSDFRQALAASAFEPSAFADYADGLGRMLHPGDPPTLQDLSRYPEVASQVLPRETLTDVEALTLIFLKHPLEERTLRDETVAAVQRAVSHVPGAGVTLTGMPVVAGDAERAIYGELSRLLAIAGVVVVLWLLIQFRSPRDVALTLGPVLFAAAVIALTLGLRLVRLNMVNLIALPLVVGLGVDYGIFLVTAARDVRREVGGRSDLIAALGPRCHAVLVCSLTTVLGFGSLLFTSTPAVRSLGLMLAVGVTACLLATLLGLAPLLIHLQNDREAR